MKAKRIFSENSKFTDLSKDRIILDLSWKEYQNLIELINAARWPNIYQNQKLGKRFDRDLTSALEKAEVEWR